MHDRTKFVKPGAWTDYGVEAWLKSAVIMDPSRGLDETADTCAGIRLLVPDSTAQIISNAVAVALTLALPHLLILLKLAIPHILAFSSRCWRFVSRRFYSGIRIL